MGFFTYSKVNSYYGLLKKIFLASLGETRRPKGRAIFYSLKCSFA